MGTFSIFHWLVIVLILAPWLILAFFAIHSARSERGVMTPGFKGWLLILVVGQWFAPFHILGQVGLHALVRDEYYRQYPKIALVDYSIALINILFVLLVIYFMTKKKRFFSKLFFLQCIWNILSIPLTITLILAVLSYYYEIPAAFSKAYQSIFPEIGKFIVSAIFNSIWLTYVLRSRRVRMTFTG